MVVAIAEKPANRFMIRSRARVGHPEGDGDIVYQQACKLGCEGIVSKRLGSLYRFGRSRHWLKIKVKIASGEGLERRMDVIRNLSMRSRGFNSLPAKAQPASRKPALHGQRRRCS
jgi:hypothetical protein